MIKGLSDELFNMLVQADKRNGFPAGTMASIMQQETGGNQKYISNPGEYHYPIGRSGQRIAGHTGKVSTAFGPFGILESTGEKPGYGVAPLKDKSLAEQVRFASDYLAARSKQAGGLEAGLSGYGEGGKYGKQVMGRINGGSPLPKGTAMAAAPLPDRGPILSAEELQTINTPVPVVADMVPPPALQQLRMAEAAPIERSWQEFEAAMPTGMGGGDMQYGNQAIAQAVAANSGTRTLGKWKPIA